MKIIRASEIGTYQFCQRAWWYKLKGYEPENKAELAAGNELHQAHGRAVFTSNCLQVGAYTALLLGILAAVAWIIQSFL